MTSIPSWASKVAATLVGPAAGRATGTGVGRGLPVEVTVIEPPAPVTSIWLMAKNSSGSPVTVTTSPTWGAVGQPPRQNTKMPSEVAGSVSASASSSWTKKASRTSLLVNTEVTTPWTVTGAVMATDEPAPCTSWMARTAGGGGGGGGGGGSPGPNA